MNADTISKIDEVSFENLINDVHEKGICGQCYGCVSFCSAGELNAIKIGDDGKPTYANKDYCLKCGICYLICPQISALDDELHEKYNWKPPIGGFRRVVSARSTNKEILKEATDGGVVTSLLMYMLERKIIDGAIVSKKTGPFSREPLIATTSEDLVAAAGSRFEDLSHVEELGRYTTYSPTISAFKNLENLDLARIAVVGTPCQIHTIRKMQVLKVLPSHIVKLTVGLFCMENFSFDNLAKEKLEKKLDININKIIKMNMKEDLIIKLDNNETIHIPFEDIDEFMRPACSTCIDFANDYADISVGGLGSPDEHTTTILRTEIGVKRFEEALKLGYIEEQKYKNLGSAQIERTKTLAKVINYGKMKRKRGLDTLKKLK